MTVTVGNNEMKRYLRGGREREKEKTKKRKRKEIEDEIYSDRERINRATAKTALNNARGAKPMAIVAEKVTKKRKTKQRKEQDQNCQLEEKKRRSKEAKMVEDKQTDKR